MKPSVDYEARLGSVHEIQWARLAAYIDGEGCISINSQHSKTASQRHFLSLSVTNTQPVLMAWIRAMFGGCVYAPKGNPKYKQVYRWQVNERFAAYVLARCLPYFIVKRSQADLGLAFIDLKQKTAQPYIGTKARISPEVIEQRDVVAREMSKLNKKTIATTIN